MHSSSTSNEQYTLDRNFYTSSEVFKLEKRLIFSNNWVCVGLSNQLTNSGDMLALEIVDIPILIVKDGHGEILAFHNICSHRGIKLVAEPCQSSDRIVCPYHAWSYSLNGKLLSTPHFKGFEKENLNTEEALSMNLKPIACREKFGLIFISLTGSVDSFDPYFEPITKRWKPYSLEELCFDKEIVYEVSANWKLALENFSESYHFPFVHPHLNEYSKMEDHYALLIENNFMIQGISSYCPKTLSEENLPLAPDLPLQWRATAEYVIAFPNLMIGIHPDHAWFLIVEPITVTTSKERLVFSFFGEQSLEPKYTSLRENVISRWDQINREDIAIVERLQQGHISPKFDGGCFSPVLEKALQHFHFQVRDSIQTVEK